MDAGLADEIVNPRDLIDHAAEVGDDFAQHLAALAVGLEIPHGFLPRAEAVLEGLHMFAEITRLAVALHEFWFEIKEVEMTGRTGHEELHDAFRLGRMMQLAAENAGQFACAGLFLAEHGG